MWKSSVELNETEQRQENHLNIKNKMLAINRSYQNTTKIENDKILKKKYVGPILMFAHLTQLDFASHLHQERSADS